MAGQGSAGNVIAAICSLFVPGLGQLVQGRLIMAIVQFVLAGVLWFFLLGWVIHLWSILDAALWKPKPEPASSHTPCLFPTFGPRCAPPGRPTIA